MKFKQLKNGFDLAEFSMEGYGSKRTMMMMMMIFLRYSITIVT
jgi:hypothetical protein